MVRFVPLLALSLLAAAPAPRPSPPPTLAVDAESRWIGFELTPAGQIRFAMTLDGAPVAALLDTGVSHSVLARTSAAVDPARLVAGGEAVAIGGRVAVDAMPVSAIAIGGLDRADGRLLVADLPAAATGGGGAVDLLVGQDLLGGVAIDIDYPRRRFRLLPSGRLPFAGEIAPLALLPGRGIPQTALTIGGRRIAPVLVDTGDGGAATLGPSVRAILPARTTSGITWGLAGPVEIELAVLSDLAVGEARLGEVEVRVEPADGFAARLGVAGRIGGGAFAGYRVLIDPGAGRMVLRRDAAPPAPPRSTSGLLLAAAADRLRVVHVMRGGPAAAAGWRAGEDICAVDGVMVASGGTATWAAGTPGRTVSLRLCDGARRALTLQRFY